MDQQKPLSPPGAESFTAKNTHTPDRNIKVPDPSSLHQSAEPTQQFNTSPLSRRSFFKIVGTTAVAAVVPDTLSPYQLQAVAAATPQPPGKNLDAVPLNELQPQPKKNPLLQIDTDSLPFRPGIYIDGREVLRLPQGEFPNFQAKILKDIIDGKPKIVYFTGYKDIRNEYGLSKRNFPSVGMMGIDGKDHIEATISPDLFEEPQSIDIADIDVAGNMLIVSSIHSFSSETPSKDVDILGQHVPQIASFTRDGNWNSIGLAQKGSEKQKISHFGVNPQDDHLFAVEERKIIRSNKPLMINASGGLGGIYDKEWTQLATLDPNIHIDDKRINFSPDGSYIVIKGTLNQTMAKDISKENLAVFEIIDRDGRTHTIAAPPDIGEIRFKDMIEDDGIHLNLPGSKRFDLPFEQDAAGIMQNEVWIGKVQIDASADTVTAVNPATGKPMIIRIGEQGSQNTKLREKLDSFLKRQNKKEIPFVRFYPKQNVISIGGINDNQGLTIRPDENVIYLKNAIWVKSRDNGTYPEYVILTTLFKIFSI